jgi:uncharacterized protein (TIGR03000 family)
MVRNKQFGWFVGALATAAVFAFSSQANAGWGSSGGWGSSSSGGWGSSSNSSGGWGRYSGSYGGWGSSSSSSGGYRHHGWRRAYRRGWGSSSSSGGYGYSGYGYGSSSSGGYGYGGSSSSGGYSNGSSSSSGGSSYQADGNWMPVDGADAAPTDAPAPPAEPDAPADNVPNNVPNNAPNVPAIPNNGTSIQDRNTTVSFSVSVPEEAMIFVNDNATTSTGTERTYISRGLKAGKSYTFHVRAEVVRNGQTVTETKKIRLIAGQHTSLAFDFAPNADEQLAEKSVETKLTLNVPAEAKVYLSGRATSTTGEVREFATTKLAAGNSWADYVVVVTYEKDGQLLSQERNVTLKAGDAREVTFDFDHDKFAVNN